MDRTCKMRSQVIGVAGLLAAVLAVAVTDAAHGASVTLRNGLDSYSGEEDTGVNTDNPNTNSNGIVSSNVGVVTAPSTRLFNSLYQFDLSPLPANASIASVTLTVTSTGGQTASTDTDVVFQLHALATPFVPNGATWNSAATGDPWTTPGGDLGVLLSTVQTNPNTVLGTTLTFGSTPGFVSAVQASYDASDRFQSAISLNMDTVNVGARALIALFTDNSTAVNTGIVTYNEAWRPTLTIEYAVVPEPTGMAALSGLGAITMLARRRGRSV